MSGPDVMLYLCAVMLGWTLRDLQRSVASWWRHRHHANTAVGALIDDMTDEQLAELTTHDPLWRGAVAVHRPARACARTKSPKHPDPPADT
jgi:hypothetical protein